MKTKNTPADTMKRIEGLEKKKADELAAISQRVKERKAALAAAQAEIKSATERTDLTAYQEAKHKEAEATAALEMYSARYGQIQRREYVTQKDSDKVIDSLIQYERDIDAEFKEAIAEPLKQLKEIYGDYKASVYAAENAISQWTSRIRANYRAAGTTFADGTNISPTPVPVHRIRYNGSDDALAVGRFLEKIL